VFPLLNVDEKLCLFSLINKLRFTKYMWSVFPIVDIKFPYKYDTLGPLMSTLIDHSSQKASSHATCVFINYWCLLIASNFFSQVFSFKQNLKIHEILQSLKRTILIYSSCLEVHK